MELQKRFVDPKEFAEIMTIPRPSIYRLLRQGKIPHIRIGKSVRIDQDAIIKNSSSVMVKS